LAQIRPITSEALEAQIRDLLPSQNGFSEDLQASNVITPIIDLTAAASGGSVPEYQAQAIAFGSQTAFDISTASVALANTAGFWRVIGTATVNVQTGGSDRRAGFTMSDGFSTKTVWQVHFKQGSAANGVAVTFDLVFFLPSGVTLNGITTADAVTLISGSYRQIADVNGTVVNPSGFTPQ
jgi:hypothetical protein